MVATVGLCADADDDGDLGLSRLEVETVEGVHCSYCRQPNEC